MAVNQTAVLRWGSEIEEMAVNQTPALKVGRTGGDKVYNVFDNQLPAALKRFQFDRQLSMENIRKLVTEADGYQPHLIAPEQGYHRLIESTLVTIRGPAEAAVDATHSILKDLVHKAMSETPTSGDFQGDFQGNNRPPV
ncbi:hypothetical protein ES319_1Z144000v1 [Gossypium barbadense]|uniref:Dynamin stalk domain-containing protein n=1 Tax=Gossypium barbadense TaxID=3634 RepID=A0A5J5NCJ2_GOSBA|nr:hypothetical protein ES319_1Z144000v1 [Gossypium barbadense]